jgi:hypothetical protein
VGPELDRPAAEPAIAAKPAVSTVVAASTPAISAAAVEPAAAEPVAAAAAQPTAAATAAAAEPAAAVTSLTASCALDTGAPRARLAAPNRAPRSFRITELVVLTSSRAAPALPTRPPLRSRPPQFVPAVYRPATSSKHPADSAPARLQAKRTAQTGGSEPQQTWIVGACALGALISLLCAVATNRRCCPGLAGMLELSRLELVGRLRGNVLHELPIVLRRAGSRRGEVAAPADDDYELAEEAATGSLRALRKPILR